MGKRGPGSVRNPDARREILSLAVSDTCKQRIQAYASKHELTVSLGALQLVLIGLALADQDKDIKNGNR